MISEPRTTVSGYAGEPAYCRARLCLRRRLDRLPAQHFIHEPEEFCRESIAAESLRVPPQRWRVERSAFAFELQHRLDQALDRLFGKPHACRPGLLSLPLAAQGHDGLRRAPTAEGNDRRPAGLRFERHDAEV